MIHKTTEGKADKLDWDLTKLSFKKILLALKKLQKITQKHRMK